jgi:hypothetical protein
VHECQERIETNTLHIQATKGGDHIKLTSSNLIILLNWHQHAKVAMIKKEDKLAAWVAIVGLSFERWTNTDNAKLLEVQSNIIKMAHMALGHFEALKKKELILAAMTMTQEEFDTLAVARNALIVKSSAPGNNHPDIDAPIPAPQLIVNLIMNAINEVLADMSGNGGRDYGG